MRLPRPGSTLAHMDATGSITPAREARRAELDTAAEYWQWAFDAAARALEDCAWLLPGDEVAERRRALVLERQDLVTLLRQVARLRAIEPEPWIAPGVVTKRMLGLPPSIRACIFDLDGVLTDSGALHAAAWAEAFDPLLLRLSQRDGWQYIPFDQVTDYRTYLDGRLRLEGIHAFLASRGIRLPEGTPHDAAGTETAYGLAARKGELLLHDLGRHGVLASRGARRFLEAAGHARLGRAVVSASTNTLPMLKLAELAHLLDARVDAESMSSRHLHSRPAPDLLLAACGDLGVDPAEAVTLTSSGAGVVAGANAGLTVIGVAGDAHGQQVLTGLRCDRRRLEPCRPARPDARGAEREVSGERVVDRSGGQHLRCFRRAVRTRASEGNNRRRCVMKVEDVMTRNVVTIAPTASLKDAATLLVQHGISGLPVVDESGAVVGVISERDFIVKEQGGSEVRRWLSWFVDPLAVAERPKLEAHTVGEAMSAPAITIAPRRAVAAAAQLMLGGNVGRLPVVSPAGLVGIVTRADLVRAFARSDEEIGQEIRDDVLTRQLWLDTDAVHVSVQAGEVTVTGTLPESVDPDRLAGIVARVPGVVAVTTRVDRR